MGSQSIERSGVPIKNIVLVHGAWADGSSWSKIVPLLQAKGLRVACVQIPLTSIADDVAATNRIVNAQDGPVLLVGHSYGGVVITEAGVNPKVAGLVYVAAFAPDEGERLADWAQPFGTTQAFIELEPIEDGFVLLSAKRIRETFAEDLSSADQNILIATQGPLQSAVLRTPIKAAAWRTKPSWFIVASNDHTISPEQQKVAAKRMSAKILTVATSHVAILAKPREVADFICEAAAG
jgi:pimeloyl-ACP methyl ester carboxylesterase